MADATKSGADILRQRMFGGGPGMPPVLVNHPTQHATPMDGWKCALFGLPFLAAGVAIEFAALNVVSTHKHAPDWLIGLIGSFFLVSGAFFIVAGLLDIARKRNHNRKAAAHPGQPWLADYHWNREGYSFSAFNEMLRRLAAAVGWHAFLIPFFWVGWNVPGIGRVFLVFTSSFALAGLIFWVRWIQMLGDLLRYGNSSLDFNSFPYFLGSQMSARLRVPRHLEVIEDLTLTLRCVQEKYVTSGTGQNRSTRIACYELYKDTAAFPRAQLAGAASSYLPVSFSLPENQPATCLSGAPLTYWEIEARGKTRAADYEAYFLLPVYKSA